MSIRKAGAAAAVASALLFLLLFAAGASADVPASGQVADLPNAVEDGRSMLPQDPLDQAPDPLKPLLPDPSSLPGVPPLPLGGSPSSPGQESPQSGSAPHASKPAIRAKPAARRPKRSASGSRRQASGNRAVGNGARHLGGTHSPRAHAKPSVGAVDLAAFHRAESARVPVPQKNAGPDRSFVGRVIEHIPPQYRFAVIGLGFLSLLLAGLSLRERRRALRVERQALVDTLTRLPNRQAFERRLAKEWKRSERYDRPLGVVLLDLDDFKQINDSQGHAAGDAVLREVAAAVCSRIRASDMAARLGGDEFVVICPETTLAGLAALAHSLEDRLQQASVRTSVGFGEREPADHGPADLVARADAAMYRRKQTAREDSGQPLSVLESAPLKPASAQ